MNDLKQCPFCGGIPQAKVEIASMGGGSDRIDFSIVCSECGTSKTTILYVRNNNSFSDVEKAMMQASKLWNTRAE